jgi:hypothetical protein
MRYQVIFGSYAEELRESLSLPGKQALAVEVLRLRKIPPKTRSASWETDR